MRQAILIVTISIIAISLVGCQLERGTAYAKYDNLKLDNLIGVWQAKYESKKFDDLSGIETLVINIDGTFQQSYNNGKGYSYSGELSYWRLVRLSNGKAQIHLEKGIFFPGILTLSENPEDSKDMVFSMYDPAQEKNILFSRKIILNIMVEFESPNHIILLDHLPVGDLDSPLTIQFMKAP